MSDVNEKPAFEIADSVPADARQYLTYVRQQIDAGLADSASGRLIDTDEMRRRLIQRKERNRHRS